VEQPFFLLGCGDPNQLIKAALNLPKVPGMPLDVAGPNQEH